jgi:tRNA nucleotidyltransferase/poly(A) polymerase
MKTKYSIVEANNRLKLNIPTDILKIHNAFKKSGKKLYVVGGAVRDAILGQTPKDFDLATDAKPDEVLDIAKRNGFSSAEVGKSFGVVIIGGHEIATFRKDIGKGRRPTSVDYTDIEGDVRRRDLTINALFYDIDRKEIVDLVGGISDLKNNFIRTVGKASERFDEDPLRKLRLLRFQFKLGGIIDGAALEALKSDPSLNGVSAERIRDEFLKSIKTSKSPKAYLTSLLSIKMLGYIFPNQNFTKSDFINNNNYFLTLAYMFRNKSPQMVSKYLLKVKYTTEDVRNIVFLIELSKFSPDNLINYKRLEKLSSLSKDDIIEWGKIIKFDLSKYANFNLSVSGNAVMKMGYSGKDIGNMISKLEIDKFLKL